MGQNKSKQEKNGSKCVKMGKNGSKLVTKGQHGSKRVKTNPDRKTGSFWSKRVKTELKVVNNKLPGF